MERQAPPGTLTFTGPAATLLELQEMTIANGPLFFFGGI